MTNHFSNSHHSAPPSDHLPGWIIILAEKDNTTIREMIERGMQGFVGDYGEAQDVIVCNGLGFGFFKPAKPLPMTTWSFFSDQNHCCFVEGVFYDAYFSCQPTDGEDEALAEKILERFKNIHHGAIENLNGSFCGFIFDFKQKKLTTFVDRLGTKILYWSYESDALIVSTNLAAFRNLKKLSLDEHAAFQFLTIGFPIGEKTLLSDVRIHLPCTVNTFHGSSKESLRYWDPPERMHDISLRDAVKLISHAMEDHAERIFARAKQKIAIGMTGGHDSRVICNSLTFRDIPFEPVVWNDGSFNDIVVRKLCSLIKKQPHVVKDVTTQEMENIQKDVFVYTDGLHMYSHGFTRLAKECFEHDIQILMTGFFGDRISGSLTIPSPQHLRNISELSTHTLQAQMELLPFRDASALLRFAEDSFTEETLSEWLQSFIRKSDHQSFSDIAIWQGIANRNLKRIRFSMIPALQYVQLIFPYLDNKVLEAYFSMPLKHLNHQRAHCYAGFYRIKDFGKYQATSYPISLRNETRFPLGVYFLRLLSMKINNLKSIFTNLPYKGIWNEKHHKIYEEISLSQLFNADFLGDLFSHRKIGPKVLYKIHTLYSFYIFFITGENYY